MNQDTAIIAASFGTTHLDTLEKCITATEQAIGSGFPSCPVYRAFTSGTVIRRLEERYGIKTPDLKKALEQVRRDGFKNAVIQPTLIMGGIEYDIIRRQAEDFTDLRISIGLPLVMSGGDCRAVADILMRTNRLAADEALVLMGHGTVHAANEIYGAMQRVFDGAGYRAFIGTVEGTPTLGDAVERLRASRAAKAALLPLMFVAGEHAKNDMAGDDEGSLRSLVIKAGIEARPVLRGLGEEPAVTALYVKRTGAALEALGL